MLPGTDGAVDLAGAAAFFEKHAKSGMTLKAIAGGGGRGMRLIRAEGEIADAFARAGAEAKSAFGNGDLYAERLVGRARHIEVQIVGDGKGGIVSPGRARMHHAAPQPEDRRDGARPEPRPALRERILAAAVAHGRP